MGSQTFPNFVDQPGCTIRNMRITGADVGSSLGSAGLDGRGKFLCQIKQVANVFTLEWLQGFGDVPYVLFAFGAGSSGTQAYVVNVITSTTEALTFEVYNVAGAAPVTNVFLDVAVFSYNTTSFMS